MLPTNKCHHCGAGSNQAHLALHPAVKEHIDRLHGMAEGLQVNLTRMFGRYDPEFEPVPVIRREARRNDQLPAFSQPTSLLEPAAGSGAAEQRLPPANWSAELPDGFDWRAYVQYHPEWSGDLDCEWKAAEHYKRHGAPNGKWYSRLRVILRYTGVMRLAVQCLRVVVMYGMKHAHGQQLAFGPTCRPLPGEVFLPCEAAVVQCAVDLLQPRCWPAVLGGLINQQLGHISVFMLAATTGAELIVPPAFTRGSFAVDEHVTPWTPLPVDQLLDMPQITDYWQRRGIVVHPVCELRFAVCNTAISHITCQALKLPSTF
jgi:hypothetical protein